MASGGTYGSPWIHKDLRDAGEACSVHRVARIMGENRLRAQIGYKRRYMKGGKIGSIADNVLERNFSPEKPNQAWVSDITYVRTHEGFCMWPQCLIYSRGALLVGRWTKI